MRPLESITDSMVKSIRQTEANSSITDELKQTQEIVEDLEEGGSTHRDPRGDPRIPVGVGGRAPKTDFGSLSSTAQQRASTSASFQAYEGQRGR